MLPDGLKELYCRKNKLVALEYLPSGLVKLFCDENYIKTLMNLPETVKFVKCSYNPITYEFRQKLVKKQCNFTVIGKI